ncbi:HAD family phosphatase [Methylibium sp. Pch-M]|uniref:HAD family hydrolase n=1 Tax=Methylibium sp. Pch-M TaxID=2082386 RepID=UPI0010133346|nr:HAD family phosphatase [Methylibium sp. Pch-M]QAZ38854.1 HAD family phosphatase [Methylibium sp. Pch-M]
MRHPAVVFDFGGVVFRWQPLALLRQVLPQHAADDSGARALAERIFQGFRLGSDWAEFDRGSLQADALAARIAARTGLAAAEVRAVIDAIPPHLEAEPGTVALLRALRDARRPLFYLSNMPAPYADHLERRHDFLAWFEAGLFSARIGLMKPEPAIFRRAELDFGIDPARSLFIDDHAGNIEAARAAGWRALHFTGPADCEAALREQGWL